MKKYVFKNQVLKLHEVNSQKWGKNSTTVMSRQNIKLNGNCPDYTDDIQVRLPMVSIEYEPNGLSKNRGSSEEPNKPTGLNPDDKGKTSP
jgi:hypothetical protein